MVPRSIMIGIAIVEQEVTFRSPSLLYLLLSRVTIFVLLLFWEPFQGWLGVLG